MAVVSTQLLDAIHRGDLDISLPQTLTLADGTALHCERLLRLLPGKRAVFVATYQQRAVLAKLFLATAQRQVQRERSGYALLRSAQQPTPDLLLDAPFAGGIALLYDYLPDALPLFDENISPDAKTLQRLLDRLQSMYAAGIYQSDLHWGNFLLNNDTAIVIDTGAIGGHTGTPLDAKTIADNLGLLIAQFRRCDQHIVRDAVLTHPIMATLSLKKNTLLQAATQHWQRRKQTLLAKCFRNTTDVAFQQQFDRAYGYRRQYAGSDLHNFLADPDHTMNAGTPLKLGNSATVVKIILDGRSVVIKRYNMKSFGHWLRRCLRPSRAWSSWRNARRLKLVGLDTPAPIAFLEMRWGPLRRRAYYVCEFTEGEELLSALQQREPNAQELMAIEQYFCIAASEQLIHGDMKATNFFLADDRLIILDLDAMHEVKNHSRWKKLFQRDFERFIRNWPDRARWLHQLKQLIAEVTA